MAIKTSKTVQIAAMSGSDTHWAGVVALLEDGSIWVRWLSDEAGESEAKWTRLPDITVKSESGESAS